MSFTPKFYNLCTAEEPLPQAEYDGTKCFWRSVGANLKLNKNGQKVKNTTYSCFQDLPDGEKCKQIRLKKIMGILNNITRDRVNVLFEGLECDSNDESYFQLLAETLFIKGMTDEPFVHHYAALYDKIISSVSPNNLKCFKEVLHTLCQTGINCLFNYNDNFFKVIGETKMFAVKRRLMSMMRFIGELACVSLPLFEREYIWTTAERLLSKGEELHLEAAYYLLFICLIRSDDNKWPEIVEKEVERISKGESSKGIVSQRIKFLFLNLHEEKNGMGKGISPYGDKLLSDLYNLQNVSTLQVKEPTTDEEQAKPADKSMKVVVLSVNDCGNIKKPNIKLLTSQIKQLNQTVNSLKFSVRNLQSVVIISFEDLFSYDWVMLNANKYAKAEERFLCIDIDKYKEARCISILINCTFVRGVELFARSHCELLKNINEYNKGLFTDGWKIIEKSVKYVLDSYYMKITCLTDCHVLSVLNSMNYSLKIGSDNARVLVNDLPTLNLSEVPVSSKFVSENFTESAVNFDKVATPAGNPSLKMDFIKPDSDKNGIKPLFCKEKHLQSNKNGACNTSDKYIEKYKCKQTQSFQNETNDESKSAVKSRLSDLPSCSTLNGEKLDAKTCLLRSRSHMNKPSLRHKLDPSRSIWRSRSSGNDNLTRGEAEKSCRKRTPKGKSRTENKEHPLDFAKKMVAFSAVTFSNTNNDKLNTSDIKEKMNNSKFSNSYPEEKSVHSKSSNLCPIESCRPIEKDKSLSELMSISMRARNIKPKDIQDRSLGESSKIKETRSKSVQKPFLKYNDKLIIRGIFPNCSAKEDHEIIELLEESNEKLCITDYMVLCRFDQDNFAQLSFIVDENSLKLLIENNLIISFDNKPLLLQKLTSWSQAMDFNTLVDS